MDLILAINPGSTSTKIGLFQGEEIIFIENIEHKREDLAKFPDIPSQKHFRLNLVLGALKKHGYEPSQLSATVGRGGLLPPIASGGYAVNEKMLDWVNRGLGGVHASNLGSILADLVAKEAGCKAYIYDAVSAGFLPEIAAITGFPEIRRKSLSHVLNSRAQSIQFAKQIGKNFEDLTLIIAHLGGGITLSVYENGVMADSIGDDIGTFSPERSGGVPLIDFVDFCFDSIEKGLTKKDIQKRIRGGGGISAHLNTIDIREVEEMISNGDENAEAVLSAMCYNIAKGIGSLASVVFGRVDAIILTGGIAKSKFVTETISERIKFIAPIKIMPGEYELEALAAGCLRILSGQEIAAEL
ncbi:MAG: butyrate kinase [Defluviitaleaceae bacterium]|nr:butyrate kinase [Defluviitaleaceae bacterium]